jgi:hypothetical protein
MTAPAGPAEPRRAGTAVVRAALAGLGVGVVVALVGEVGGLTLYLAQGANGAYRWYARLGAIYVELFHHVEVGLQVRPFGGGRPLVLDLGVALGAVLGLALVALGWVGRRIASLSSGAATGAAIAAVAAAYASVPVVAAFVARGRVELPPDITFAQALDVNVSPVSAFVVPFVLALAAATLGALLARGDGARRGDEAVGDVVAGGVRAFGFVIVLAVVGLLIVASVRPSLARAYSALITVPDSVKGDVVLVAHAALLAPDQAMWALAPAMGACDEVVVDGRGTPFLCYWRTPTTLPLLPAPDVGLAPNRVTYRRAPRGYLGFLLVPLLATMLGGLRAGRGRSSVRGRVAAGASSGLVFAGLVTVGFALARIDASVAGGFLGRSAFRLAVGPEVVRGGAFAAAWGVIGGAIGGAALARTREVQDTPGLGAASE